MLERMGELFRRPLAARELEEPRIHRLDPELAVLQAEDCRGDRQRIEQAAIVRCSEMRSHIRSVRPTDSLNPRRPGSCSLHFRSMAERG